MRTPGAHVAHQVMRSGVVTVSPELPLPDLEELLTGEEISGAPVTDDDGRVVGIVSKSDIVRYESEAYHAYRGGQESWPGADDDARVGDIMTREVVTVPPHASVHDIARIMVDGSLHRVIVAKDDGVEGIVTSLDLLRAFVEQQG
jgi:CBS domain-containing protein